MVVVSKLPNVKFGPNDYREDALPFIPLVCNPIFRWKKEMEKQSVKTESSSDSTSEDSDSDRDVKSEFVKSEPQYSPGCGGGESPNGESYTPAKPKKEKPYRPGGFFFDDDEEEEEDEDNEMAGFIQGRVANPLVETTKIQWFSV